MEEGDTDWERAHLRVGVVWRRQTPTGRERTLEWKGMSGGGRHRLEEGALESESGVEERDEDWERAHLRVEGNEWRRETPTGRGRT